MRNFNDAQGQLTPQSSDGVWPKFELIMSLFFCKNEEDPVKSEGAIVATTLFFRLSSAANSVVSDRIWPKFEHNEAFIVVLINCKNDEDPFKE